MLSMKWVKDKVNSLFPKELTDKDIRNIALEKKLITLSDFSPEEITKHIASTEYQNSILFYYFYIVTNDGESSILPTNASEENIASFLLYNLSEKAADSTLEGLINSDINLDKELLLEMYLSGKELLNKKKDSGREIGKGEPLVNPLTAYGR